MPAPIRRLARELAELQSLLRVRRPVLDGYLYRARVRCGRKACRCMNSEHRHSMWCLSYQRDGRSHTRTVPPAALATVRESCARYRGLRRLRHDVAALAGQVTAAIDRHVRTQATRGWERFESAKNPDRCGGRR